jgi:hypothetical protein
VWDMHWHLNRVFSMLKAVAFGKSATGIVLTSHFSPLSHRSPIRSLHASRRRDTPNCQKLVRVDCSSLTRVPSSSGMGCEAPSPWTQWQWPVALSFLGLSAWGLVEISSFVVFYSYIQ